MTRYRAGLAPADQPRIESEHRKAKRESGSLLPRFYSALVLTSVLMVELTAPSQQPVRADGRALTNIEGSLRKNDFHRALELSRTALAKNIADPRLWTLSGMAWSGMGNRESALKAYKRALKLSPNYLPALEGAAQTEFQLGDFRAKDLLRKVLAQLPNDATSHALLGISNFKEQNCRDAVEEFHKALLVIASSPDVLAEYGACLGTLKREEEAIPVLAQVLVLEPTKPEARYNLALVQWTAGHANDALETIQPLLNSRAVDGDALVLSAEILEWRGDTKEAADLLRKALIANPRNLDVYLQLASLSVKHGSAQVGIDFINGGIVQLPNEPKLYLVRGILQTQLGEFTRASEDFEAANRLDPQLRFLGLAEGLVETQMHHRAEALASFRAVVKARPNEAYAQYLLAEALQTEGLPAGSTDYSEAMRAAIKAVKLDPNLVAAHDLLSSLYIESGHADEAIEESRAALALDPNDQEAIYHWILALRKKGEKSQIPQLLERLVAVRKQGNSISALTARFRLAEAPNLSITPLVHAQ